MKQKLNEIFTAIPFQILEAKEIEENGKTKFRVKGIFNRADERNANNRIYPSKLLEREHSRLNERLAKGETVFMQADHPSDGLSKIGDTTALMRSVVYDPGTKLVTGEADIISTRKGSDLKEIIRAGGQVGISARGFGTTSPGEVAGQKGDVVNEDYQLVTYDFVVGQSTRGAVISQFAEQARALAGLTEENEMDLKTLDLEALKAARPDLISTIENSVADKVKAENAKTLAAMVAEETGKIEAKLREEMKLEKKGDKKNNNDDEDDMKEMIAAASHFGYRIEATRAQDNSRYGGGKGRSSKGVSKTDGSEAEDQETLNPPEYQRNDGKGKVAEAEVVAWAKKNGLKLEKSKKSNDDEDEVEEQFENLNAQIRDLKKINEQNTARTQQLEETNRANEVRAHIFDVCKGEKKFKNALIERLLQAGLKTVAEVDARVPVEKAAIEKLLIESSGGAPGKGHTAEDEPVGHNEEGKYTVVIDGKKTTLTEAEVRQRNLAGLTTELVEQAK